MKLAIRVSALACIVAAAVASNSLPRNHAIAAVHAMTGPAPTCNPFTQTCPNIRTK
jgi:hypothetical protein